jgi:hypothetical protein
MSIQLDRTTISIDDPQSDEGSGFWQRFEHAFDGRAEEVFSDRLHPLKVMGRSIQDAADSWAETLDRADRGVQSAFVKSVEFTARDASLALPFADWLEDRHDSFSQLLVNSVDAVEEESVSPLDPTYRPGERAWWQSLSKEGVLRYGIRPFRADPYTFVSLRLSEADRLLLLGHVRYFFRNFGDHRFELAVSLPVAHGMALDIGTAYQFGRHEDEKKVVLKLFKPLKFGGILHVGVEVQRSPAMFAGISLPL